MPPKRKHLLYLADASNVHTQRWCRHWVRQGYKVTVCSFDAAYLENVPVIPLPNRMLLPFKLHRLSSIWGHLRTINGVIADIRPDILHAHYASSYGLLGALTRFSPFIISVWGSDVFDFPRKSLLHRALLEFNLRRADVICSTSQAMADETRKYSDGSIVTTPFGIDTDKYHPFFSDSPQSTRQLTIGTVRKLESVYGVDVLIRAFAILTAKCPELPVRVTIVGDGSQRRELERLARSLRLSGRIDFVGSVSPSEVPSWLNKFDLFAALSRQESFGVAVLEASACALPVVVSDVGGLPEVVVHNRTGVIVPCENPHAAAAAFADLLGDAKLRTALGRAGRAWVQQRYSWPATAQELEAVYDRVSL